MVTKPNKMPMNTVTDGSMHEISHDASIVMA